MITANFSKKFDAVKKRLQRLPEIQKKVINTASKKDAVGVIETYQEGIRNDDFGLERLSIHTIRQKEGKGYVDPALPLYGAGDDEKNSIINTLRIRKIKNGYRVFRSRARHHESDLPLNVLLGILEEGAVIKRGKTIIIIPPRPVVDPAFRRYLASKKKRENVSAAREAIQIYIDTGSMSAVKKFTRGLKRRDFDET